MENQIAIIILFAFNHFLYLDFIRKSAYRSDLHRHHTHCFLKIIIYISGVGICFGIGEL